jgi:hypothetical protein
MTIMILWSGFIGYRRFHQGVLINHGRTRTIGTGTVLRIVASISVAVLLGVASELPGAVIGACSLMVAVFVEMLYVHVISRVDIRQLLADRTGCRRLIQPVDSHIANALRQPYADAMIGSSQAHSVV